MGYKKSQNTQVRTEQFKVFMPLLKKYFFLQNSDLNVGLTFSNIQPIKFDKYWSTKWTESKSRANVFNKWCRILQLSQSQRKQWNTTYQWNAGY